MAFLSEAEVEQALLDQLHGLDYSIESEEDIGPDGHRPERESHDEVVLKKRFENAVARLNPGLPPEAHQDAVRKIMQSELPSLLEENRRIHKLMTEGVDVEYYATDGTLAAGKVALIDFEWPERNDWLAVRQFVVISGQYKRRPDVVVFVNGLPLGVIELKAPGSGNATLIGAFNQLQTYKNQIPALFNTNALLVTSDGIVARVGSLSADLERFMPWRTTDGHDVAPKGAPELSTLIEGVFDQNRLLIGFTGTPIEADDVNTPTVFGNYIDIYDISRAVEDGATVPIYYESRLDRIELYEDEKPKIDAEVNALTDDVPEVEQERFKQKWSTVEALVGSDKRLALVAKDLVTHFEDRVAALDGKAMVVCMSRRICVKLYEEIVKLRPDWHNADDHAGAVKIVMTGAASDAGSWQQHVGNKTRRDLLAKRARDPKDPLKIVIVRDMWLTGFDAPCMHTMYIDKPMQGHGLMQAIARVNRVFRDKPAGLIVDYVGVAQNLKSALQQYSRNDQENTGVDEAQAVAVMVEKYEIVRDMYHGFDYASAMAGTPQARLAMITGAIEWILDLQQKLAAKETTADGKKNAHRRYADAVLALSKAFSLASASDEARQIREDVGFFQAIRAALVKSSTGSGVTQHDRELAIQQIVSRAVVSTEIIDILAAAGIKSPDISILSDEFLAEVQQMERKNLALEALRKLLNDGIRSRSKANVVQTKAFSERLEDAIARYHANAITTADVLQELIQLAKDIRAARQRGEESGLSDEEIAFYDALAENESAVQMMGDDKLRLIAHELLVSLRENVTVDWAHRESARARMRVLVKRILRKYGYPPDLQDAAVQIVLQQTEALSATWTSARF